jgi:hypothetical protein
MTVHLPALQLRVREVTGSNVGSILIVFHEIHRRLSQSIRTNAWRRMRNEYTIEDICLERLKY